MIQPADASHCDMPAYRHARLGIGIAVVLVSLGWAWMNLDQGWFPHDEGQLGQAAERILQGQVPHRDFDEMYTGGLSFLNALSFRLWGVDSHSMRLMLLVWFVPFVGAVYWLASTLTRPLAAALATMLAACWSIPMYSAAMPSWYNLFFAIWATCCLATFIKIGKHRYLCAAGFLIGLSITFKISGMFVLAAALLWLVYRNQETETEQSQTNRLIDRAFSSVLTLSLIAASLIALIFVNRHDPASQTVHFVLPFLSLTGFLIFREWTLVNGDPVRRLKTLLLDSSCLAIGTMIPLLALVAYFSSQDALSELIHGALIAPGKRAEFASTPFPFVASIVLSLPIICLLFPTLVRTSLAREIESKSWIAVAVVAVILLALKDAGVTFGVTYLSIRNLTPLLVVCNLALLFRMRNKINVHQQQILFLLTATSFFMSLIQFPFAAPIYFFYFAPSLLLAALASLSVQRDLPWRSLSIVGIFLLSYSCMRFHNPEAATCMTSSYERQPSLALKTVRSQIVVDEATARAFNRVHDLVAMHTKENETILATPDSPEISFLTNRRAFNGVMYEFFQEGLYSDYEALRSQLRDQQVRLVIIKERPPFSAEVDQAFRREALQDYHLIETVTGSQDDLDEPVFSVYKLIQS